MTISPTIITINATYWAAASFQNQDVSVSTIPRRKAESAAPNRLFRPPNTTTAKEINNGCIHMSDDNASVGALSAPASTKAIYRAKHPVEGWFLFIYHRQITIAARRQDLDGRR